MREFRQLFALHAHPLGVAHQMRRTVYANLVARRHQHRFQGTAGGAFAVGPRDRKDKRRRFYYRHPLRDLADARQPKIDSFAVQMFQIRKPRSQGRRGLRNRLFFHDVRQELG